MGQGSPLRRISVRTRLFVVSLLVSLVPAVAVGVYAYRTYTRATAQKLADSAAQTARLLNDALTRELARYQGFIDVVSVHDLVQESLGARQGGAALKRTVDGMIVRQGYFLGLRIVAADGVTLYDTEYTRVSENNFHKLLADADGMSPKDSLSHIGGYPSGLLTIGRKIYRYAAGTEHIGYIFAFVSDRMPLGGVFGQATVGGGGVTLVSADGVVLAGTKAAPGENLAGTELFARLRAAEQAGQPSFKAATDGGPSLVVFSRNDRYGAYLLASFPESYLNAEAERSIGMLAAFVAAAVALAITLSMWIYRQYVADLDAMAQTKEADQRRKRELELAALQYQINPHFLFNTLGTLK
jgi:hypothetical protein